ncbi:MAG TPA: hypothetical protein VMR23_15070 [Candidatus Limnocylindria bacterium]|nr:hypothetical protein [Candidatus Limnocylindria bacterium]
MRRLACALVACGLLATASAAGAEAVFVDAAVGVVDGSVVTAGDIALARALGLVGFTPSAVPIDAAAVERMIRAHLIVAEARLLDIGPAPGEEEAAWQAAAARVGGMAALQRWLAIVALEPAAARALVGVDLRWRRFIDVRFRAFAFVTPEEVAAALGPGPHDAEAEERARARLAAAQAERELKAWLRQRAQQADAHVLLTDGVTVPNPFPMPR